MILQAQEYEKIQARTHHAPSAHPPRTHSPGPRCFVDSRPQ